MKAFILAAGYGERLRPVTDEIPKPLVPVVNVPAICYALMLCAEAGIREVVVNLHYRPDEIRKYFDENARFGMEVHFSYEETILGTGGGVKKCADILAGGDFVLLNGDVITDVQLADIIARHRTLGAEGTVMLADGSEQGVPGDAGTDGTRVVDFRNFLETGERGPLVNTGLAVLSPRVLEFCTAGFSSIVYTAYVALIRRRTLHYYEHTGLWRDIGSVSSYLSAGMALMGGKSGLEARMYRALGITMHDVSGDTRIGPGADIRDSVIGSGAEIGAGALVERSVVLPGGRVPAGDRVSGAVVTRDRVLAAGVDIK
ncbi:MAG: NDP-sugar synthase [Spirochaetes bacterium]|nr:MAG: NDP-sugar synthase [Spirochaetota bacterium]